MKRASLLGAALLVLSCGVSPATTTPDTYADFLKLSSQLSCEASLRCCGTVCTPTTDAAFYQSSTRALDYLKAGLLSYDRQAAGDCLAALQIRYTSCDAAISELPPSTACGNVLSPRGSVGSTCETGITTCGPDTFCVNLSCAVRRPANQSCNANLSNSLCLNSSDTCCTACTGVCAAGLAIGQACNNTANALACQSGAFCPQGVNKCTVYAESGQPCMDVTLLCNPRSGLVCLPASQTCGVPQPNDRPCTNATQCMSAYCLLPNFPATTQGTCRPQPVPLSVRQQLCQAR